MKSRRKSREACLQALYQIDALEEWNRECVELYFSVYQKPEELLASSKENYDFSLSLIHGVLENLDFLDTSITGASTHWSIARMCRVDRNILRLSTFEIGFVADIPISVSINEGIELAKLYGSDDSPMFVNGVLDNVARSFLNNPKLAHIVPHKERKKLVVNE